MGCALGDIELVREQPDASAQKRAEHVILANRAETADIETQLEVGRRGQTHRGAVESRIPNPESRSAAVVRLRPHQRVAARGDAQRRAGARELDDERAAFDRRHASDAELRIEAVSEVIACLPRQRRHLQMISSPTNALGNE